MVQDGVDDLHFRVELNFPNVNPEILGFFHNLVFLVNL